MKLGGGTEGSKPMGGGRAGAMTSSFSSPLLIEDRLILSSSSLLSMSISLPSFPSSPVPFSASPAVTGVGGSGGRSFGVLEASVMTLLSNTGPSTLESGTSLPSPEEEELVLVTVCNDDDDESEGPLSQLGYGGDAR